MDTLRYLSGNAIAAGPLDDQPVNSVTFRTLVATGTPGATNYSSGLVDIKVWMPTPAVDQPLSLDSNKVWQTAVGASGVYSLDFVETETPGDPSRVSYRRFVGSLTQHIATFTATRVSTYSMQIFMRLVNFLRKSTKKRIC